MNSDSDVILDAYYDEKMKIQEHYAHVIRELDTVRNTLAGNLADNPEYVSILNAMVFVRIQTVTNINFEVKEFNSWTCDDIPVSYYPSGMGKSEIAKIQDDIKLLDRVAEGHVYGNIFAAKSLVYIGCPKKREDIVENATQIFPLTLEQFGNYVKTIGVAIANLKLDVNRAGLGELTYMDADGTVSEVDKAVTEMVNEYSDDEKFKKRQDMLEATMKQLNVDILGPMNDWRDAYLGEQDDKSEVSRREMKL